MGQQVDNALPWLRPLWGLHLRSYSVRSSRPRLGIPAAIAVHSPAPQPAGAMLSLHPLAPDGDTIEEPVLSFITERRIRRAEQKYQDAVNEKGDRSHLRGFY
jgi:hypothetical protein